MPDPQPQHIMIFPGDLFFTRSRSFLGKAIRFLERSKGEAPSIVNHVGVFIGDKRHDPVPLAEAVAVEAMIYVRLGRFWKFYHGQDVEVEVRRALGISMEQRRAIARHAVSYRGRPYGAAKLPLHAIDWVLARLFGRPNVYFARRLAIRDSAPICSYLAEDCCQAGGVSHGVAVGAAQPDDMWDFGLEHPKEWARVLKLQRI